MLIYLTTLNLTKKPPKAAKDDGEVQAGSAMDTLLVLVGATSSIVL